MTLLETLDANARVGTFFFIDDDIRVPELNAELISLLQASARLSAEDTRITNLICHSLEQDRRLPFNLTAQEVHYLRRHPQSKWLDYLIYRYKFTQYPVQKVVADFPVYLLVEPMSVCNLRCVMCFQVDKSFTRKPYMGMMDFSLFQNVIDQAEEGGTQAITLASRGEPTLHPKLPEMLRYMGDKFIEVKLTTNATHMPDNLIHEILSSGVTMVVFSVDAYTKEVYEDIRRRGKFDEVLFNIRRFNEIRAQHYPDSKITTRVSGVAFRPDQDVAGFHNFWSPLVDEVGFKAAQARWNTYENTITPEVTNPCMLLWERMYVWFDGSTNPCDLDYKSKLSPGNVRDKTIREIWHGPQLTKLREDHLNERRGQHVPCDRCGFNS